MSRHYAIWDHIKGAWAEVSYADYVKASKIQPIDDSVLFQGEHGALHRFYRLHQTLPVYNVTFGDAGWECEPGVYLEPRERAMDAVATAIAELQEILALLSKEPRDV